MADKIKYRATVSWGSILAKVLIIEGHEYTEDDFLPGGLLDGLRGGVLVPVGDPPKPSPKRVKIARSSNDSTGNAGGKRRRSRSTRKD